MPVCTSPAKSDDSWVIRLFILRGIVNKQKKITLILLILFVSIGLDQISKVLANQYLKTSPPLIYLGDVFRFQYSQNVGAILSLGANISEQGRFWAFTVFVGVVLIGMLIYLFASHGLTTLAVVAISLIIGGGLSNLISRLLNGGYVVDFMNLGIGRIRTGVFNFADVAIMAGLGLLIVMLLLPEKTGDETPE